jgi:hypothetical protein
MSRIDRVLCQCLNLLDQEASIAFHNDDDAAHDRAWRAQEALRKILLEGKTLKSLAEAHHE